MTLVIVFLEERNGCTFTKIKEKVKTLLQRIQGKPVRSLIPQKAYRTFQDRKRDSSSVWDLAGFDSSIKSLLLERRYKWTVVTLQDEGDYWLQNNTILIIPPMAQTHEYERSYEETPDGKGGRQPGYAKNCLITVGATAPFPELIHAALQDDCQCALAEEGFTRITFQCGDSLSYFHDLLPLASRGLDLVAFTFKKAGLHDDIFKCKEIKGVSKQGLAISHAGAGTILDVMRMGVPLIVVPNPELLDGHQEELAVELEQQGYVTRSDCKGLAKAIRTASSRVRNDWSENKDSAHGVSYVADQSIGYQELQLDGE